MVTLISGCIESIHLWVRSLLSHCLHCWSFDTWNPYFNFSFDLKMFCISENKSDPGITATTFLKWCLDKIFQSNGQFCEKRLTLEVWSCKVYNISNSSASHHLCPLTWSALSWPLLSLSANLRNSICLKCKMYLSELQIAFVQ